MSPTMETPMYVIKRDGTVKDFDISKIAAALEKAGKATGEFDAATANRITHIEVMNRLAHLPCLLIYLVHVRKYINSKIVMYC